MSKITPLATVFLVLAMVTGCSENPTFPEHDGDLSAEVTFSLEHLSTLTEFTITVHVEDGHGDHVTTMVEVRAEFRHHGDVDWESLLLQLEGEEFTGTYMLMSSGDYDFRVLGVRQGSVGELVLYEAAEHMEVDRIHLEVGDYVVEFETFPGHVREGAEAAVTFWVMEADPHGYMVEGLHAEIHVVDADGSSMEHAPHEEEPGVYEAHHTFLEAGVAQLRIHFEGHDNVEYYAEFQLPVSHGQ